MSTLERIEKTVRHLPPASQRQVLDFAESLARGEHNGTAEDFGAGSQPSPDGRLAAMRAAMNDPLFLSDLEEVNRDFQDTDLDEVIG